MKVTAYINGYSSGRASTDATFTITMRSKNGSHQNTIPVKNSSINEAELYALQYVVNAIDMDLNEIELTINTSNAYVYGMFHYADDTWTNKPKRNSTLIKEIRSLLEEVESFTMKMDRHSKTMKMLSKRSKTIKNKLKDIKSKETVS